MGAQQVKEGRSGAVSSGISGGGGSNNVGGLTNNSTFGAGTSLRASRIKSRSTKDSKLIGSNIFTEHSGKFEISTRGNCITTIAFHIFFFSSVKRNV